LGYFPSGSYASRQAKAEWIRPDEKGMFIWGIRGGAVIAVWPSAVEGEGVGGPRGLFRIGYEREGMMRLVNFVAVEPIVGSKRGLSELEPSSLIDGEKPLRLRSGKFFWPSSEYPPHVPGNVARDVSVLQKMVVPGWLSNPSPGVEQLNIAFDVEKFNNGAHPWIVASIRSDRPEEITFTIHAAPDSAPMQSCILTATMGNYIRARQLWLGDRIVDSKTLWPDPATAGVERWGFTRPAFFDGDSLSRLADGSVFAAITTDEENPSQVIPELANWRYRGHKVTQYWRIYPHDEHPVRVKVNGRFTYWMSNTSIPNGVAYENFELVQDYFDGQQFVFGVTQLSPRQFKLKMKHSEPIP